MKRTMFIILLFVSLLFWTCCKKDDTKEFEPDQSYLDEKYQNIAVISIETKRKTADVLDFVTKPVSGHVATQIASWTPGYEYPPAPYYEDCYISLKDEKNEVLFSGVSAKVKVRGNWTTNYEKKPLRIKFDEKQEMLGLNDGAQFKNWLLLAEYKDGSMLRNKASLMMAREIVKEEKLYAADAKLVEVLINGEYWGVYLLTEMQQVQKNRVDITETIEDTSVYTGYFLEMDGYYDTEEPLKQFFVDYYNNAPLTPYDGEGGSGKQISPLNSKNSPKKDIGFSIKSTINTKEQHDFIASYVNNVYNIMYEAAYNKKAFVFDDEYKTISESKSLTPKEAVEKVVDIPSLVDAYLIAELTCDADIYWSSFYMSVDFGPGGNRKLTFEAPWDFDSGLGNKRRCVDGTGYYACNKMWDVDDKNYETVNPWLVCLAYEDWYRELISEKWNAVYKSGTFDRVIEMIEKDTADYADAFIRNYEKWNNLVNNFSFANELSPRAKNCKTQLEAATYLKSWIKKRVNFLEEVWGQ